MKISKIPAVAGGSLGEGRRELEMRTAGQEQDIKEAQPLGQLLDETTLMVLVIPAAPKILRDLRKKKGNMSPS
jgi:hypothetical protein